MRIRTQMLVVSDRPVHMAVAGPDGAPALLLVHGIGVSNWYFRPLMRRLAADFRVIAPDLPGFGSSPDARGHLTVEDYARLLVSLTRQENLGSQGGLILAGHSMGCQIITEMASQAPDIGGSLVLMGPTIEAGRRSVRQQAGRLLLDATREPLRTTAVVTMDYIRCSTLRYIRTVRPMLYDRIEERLARDIPAAASNEPAVLIIRGSRDPIATREWCERLAVSTPHARLLEIPGAAHNFQHGFPDATAAALRDFMRRAAGRPAT